MTLRADNGPVVPGIISCANFPQKTHNSRVFITDFLVVICELRIRFWFNF